MTGFLWYMTIQLPNGSEFSGTSQGREARSKPELLRTCIAKSEGRERVEFTLPAKVRFDLNQVLRNRGRSLLFDDCNIHHHHRFPDGNEAGAAAEWFDDLLENTDSEMSATENGSRRRRARPRRGIRLCFIYS